MIMKMKMKDTLMWAALVFLLPGVSLARETSTAAQAGDNVIFFTDHTASAEKLHFIEWTVNGHKIVTYTADGFERRAEAYADRIELDYYNGYLKLKNVLPTDSGDYSYSVKTAQEVRKMKKKKKAMASKLQKVDKQDDAYGVRVTKCAIAVVCLFFSVMFLLCAPLFFFCPSMV
ncbi:uncharacterized protein LOC144005860 [Festucalex cinctus]